MITIWMPDEFVINLVFVNDIWLSIDTVEYAVRNIFYVFPFFEYRK